MHNGICLFVTLTMLWFGNNGQEAKNVDDYSTIQNICAIENTMLLDSIAMDEQTKIDNIELFNSDDKLKLRVNHKEYLLDEDTIKPEDIGDKYQVKLDKIGDSLFVYSKQAKGSDVEISLFKYEDENIYLLSNVKKPSIDVLEGEDKKANLLISQRQYSDDICLNIEASQLKDIEYLQDSVDVSIGDDKVQLQASGKILNDKLSMGMNVIYELNGNRFDVKEVII